MQIRTLASAVAIGVSLSACFAGGGGPANHRGLESLHQPVVTMANYVIDVPAPSGELAPSAEQQIAEWLDAMNVRYGDRVSIDDTAIAAGSRPAREMVHGMLERKGMMLETTAPITQGLIAPGHLRIIITRSRAAVPGCPDWSTRSAADYNATVTSNYGCATNANLAGMVADPLDLVRGQSDRSNDPLTASRAINTYRNAPPTGAGGLGGGAAAPAAPAIPGGGGR